VHKPVFLYQITTKWNILQNNYLLGQKLQNIDNIGMEFFNIRFFPGNKFDLENDDEIIGTAESFEML